MIKIDIIIKQQIDYQKKIKEIIALSNSGLCFSYCKAYAYIREIADIKYGLIDITTRNR